MSASADAISEVLKTIRQAGPARDGASDERTGSLPRGGLGQLGVLADMLRGIYTARSAAGLAKTVKTPLRKMLLIAAADHGVGRHGISHYPQATTGELVRDVLAGRAAVARLTPKRQVRAVVADFGLSPDIRWDEAGWAEFDSRSVARGTSDLSEAPAMPRETALAAINAGIECFRRWSSGWDVDLLGTGDLGLGASVSACALAVAITGSPVDEMTGDTPGAPPTPPRTTRATLVRRALERASPPDPHDAVGLLAEYGGLEIGALVGACLAAASRQVPVLLDGVVSTAAAAIAGELAPAVRGYFAASHCASIPAHQALLDHLGLEPLLRLQLNVGEGVGAVLAMDLVEACLELAAPD